MMAEASLMALLEAMLSLAARPALVRRPTINVKAGGYPDDIFLDLTEEQKENLQCSICYQVIKEVMECRNKHKFCFSCIQVWSTSGEYLNRIRCPVCRCEGHYSKNTDFDNKVNMNRVKCTMEGCSWKGLLKYHGTHKHSNYKSDSSSDTSSLPSIKNVTGRPSESSSRLRPSESSSRLRLPRARSSSTASTGDPNNNIVSSSVDYDNATLSHPENNNNSITDSEPLSPMTPVPPRAPRPSFLPRRRVPTLPSIMNNTTPVLSAVAPASTSVFQPSTGLLSRRHASQSQNTARSPGHSQEGNLTTVRDRLVESRERLEGLMSAFGDDADRHMEVEYTFQEERDINRQQQLQEVHELGRRLGQVAAELRQLLDHRRIMSQDSDSD